jgi:hypothetical protein
VAEACSASTYDGQVPSGYEPHLPGSFEKPNRNVIARLTQRSQQCAIASVVWNELKYGSHRLERGRRKDELEAYLEVVSASFPILPYDREAAAWHMRSSAPGKTGLGSAPHTSTVRLRRSRTSANSVW